MNWIEPYRSFFTRRLRVALLGIVVATWSFIGPDRANAQTDERRDSHAMMVLLRPITSTVQDSMARVMCGSRSVALGMIVDKEGYVLTKRSELTRDPIKVQLGNGRLYRARLASVDRTNDLALLRIDADIEFKPIRFENYLPPMASFLITPGRTGRAIGLGVLAARVRTIAPDGRLGVQLSESEQGGALVNQVIDGSGADDAGIAVGDVIVGINGRDYRDRRRVMETLRLLYPAEEVRLTVLRRDEDQNSNRLEIDAQIREFERLSESENDSRVNGPRNDRISGFERVIQHDTVLDPDECGGPILDTQGRVVGMNIARAGRVVSYALPSSLVNLKLDRLLEQARRN